MRYRVNCHVFFGFASAPCCEHVGADTYLPRVKWSSAHTAEVQKYIFECLKLGKVLVLANEVRRGHVPRWIPVEDQHADELSRMNRISHTATDKNEMVIVAIDPDHGRIALLMMDDPNNQLNFNCPESLAGGKGNLEGKDEAMAARILANSPASVAIAEALKSGAIKTLEDLSRLLPAAADEETVKDILSSARESAIDLEIQGGRVRLGGVGDLIASLPSERSHVVRATIRSVDDDARKTGLIGFKISHVESSSDLMHHLVKGRLCHATLRTINNSRTLRLFDFARYHAAEVTLELKLSYQIKSQRLEVEITSILKEDSLLKLDRPVQERLADF